jgi:aldehyde dehydrogenase (NAD+)
MQTLIPYIAGRFVSPVADRGTMPVVNPATEETVAQIALCGPKDVDLAVAAAKEAFATFGMTTLDERIALLEKLNAVFKRRYEEMVTAITTEMGAPHDLSKNSQAACGPGHIEATIAAARQLDWESRSGSRANLVREPVGVCVLITPWNWPMNQLAAKVAPALAAGCTVILKPSELSPLSAQLFAEMLHEAGYPAGVFNMLHGTGPDVGAPLSSHPDVDMVSFTGSTRAGIQVAKAAADTVKRVSQELGGKSPNIVFADADLPKAIRRGVLHCFNNSGQSCNAPTRMLVEASVYDEAVRLAVEAGAKVQVGDPTTPGGHIGPVVSKAQWEKIQGYIRLGTEEGASVVLGGPGRPEGLEHGYYVRPTIFANVRPGMRIEHEEIFGPVLCMIPFKDLEEAIRIANDTPYGLAAYVQTGDPEKAKAVARRLRAGSVYLNGAPQDYESPFGGFKQSGNGREWGMHGLLEYLELKSINGFYAA